MNYKIELNNVSKTYKDKVILKDVNLKLEKGKIYGLVGSNGSGKSTLIRTILGLNKTMGNVVINSYGIKTNYKNAMKSVGALIDNANLYDYLTVEENLRYFAIMEGIPITRVKETLNIIKIENKKMVKQLSLGNKQKLGIALSLLKNPDVLILDEPTNGLDIESIKDLRTLLLSFKDKTILISSHNVSELEKLIDEVILINEGNVIKRKIEHNNLEDMLYNLMEV